MAQARHGLLIAWFAVASCAKDDDVQLPASSPPIAVVCGELEVPTGDGKCSSIAASAESCGARFRPIAGGCEPVLPPTPCAKGTMALPGDESCTPVADCGSDPYGVLPTGDVVYVDAAAPIGGDGSRDKPLRTIAEALATKVADPIVALAAGSYTENVKADRRVRLFGRCPAMVEIKGVDASVPTIDAPKVPIELHRIAVTSGGIGIRAYDTAGVRIEQVWVHDTGERALVLEGPNRPTEATVRRLLVERPIYVGIQATGATLLGEDIVVRDVALRSGSGGFGVTSNLHPAGGLRGTTRLHRAVIERAKQAGVGAYGADLELRDVVIKDVGYAKGAGFGVFYSPAPGAGVCGALDVDRVFVSGAVYAGVAVRGCTAKISHSTVRNVVADPKGAQGEGIQLAKCTASVDQVLIERVQHVGLVVEGATVEASRLIVRAVEPAPAAPHLGIGVGTIPIAGTGPTSLSLFDSVIYDVHTLGLLVGGANVEAARLHVHDVKPSSEGKYGDGIGVSAILDVGATVAATANVHDTLIAKVARAGIHLTGGDATVARTTMVCAGFPIETTARFIGGERPQTLKDGGENLCAPCQGEAGVCLAQSSDLEPVAAPKPGS